MSDLFGRAKDMLHSDKGEEMSDKGLDAAAKLAGERTGGRFDDQIAKGRDAADAHVGNEGSGGRDAS